MNNDRHPNLGLNGIYHPYFRPACDEVEIVVERDQTGNERVRLQPAAHDSISLARLDSLRHVFKLQQRWQDRLQEQTLQKNVRTHLLSAFVHREQPDQLPDARWLGQALDRSIPVMIGEIGHKDWATPTVAYAYYLADNPQLHPAALRALIHTEQGLSLRTKVTKGRFPRVGLMMFPS